jgi:hypothetical protein
LLCAGKPSNFTADIFLHFHSKGHCPANKETDMENIATPITKEEAQAELDRATAAALAEYHRAMTAARVEYMRVEADASAKLDSDRAVAWAEYWRVQASLAKA